MKVKYSSHFLMLEIKLARWPFHSYIKLLYFYLSADICVYISYIPWDGIMLFSYFLKQFQVPSKIKKVQRFPIHLLPTIHTCIVACITDIHSPQSGIFVITDEPTLIYYHQSPEFVLGFSLHVVHSMEFDTCTMTCIHHRSNIQNSFSALKLLCVPPHCGFDMHFPNDEWRWALV